MNDLKLRHGQDDKAYQLTPTKKVNEFTAGSDGTAVSVL